MSATVHGRYAAERRRTVNAAARDAIILAMSGVHDGNSEEAGLIATEIVKAIAKGEIPHCKIEY